MELIAALKEGAVATLFPSSTEQSKEEGGSSSGDAMRISILLPGERTTPVAMSRIAPAMQAALAAVEEPPLFEPLRLFMLTWRRGMEDSIAIRCSASKTSDVRRRIIPARCTHI